MRTKTTTKMTILQPSEKVAPKTKPTEASVLAEAALLGDAYSEVTAHPADLVADAEEMVTRRADAAELERRGYDVNDFLFEKIVVLSHLLAPMAAKSKQVAEAAKLKTEDGEAARQRLIVIRDRLGRIGAAAGLPPSIFSLDTKSTSRLNVIMMRMEEVLLIVGEYLPHLPDQEKVQALVTEARSLIDQNKDARRGAKLLRGERTLSSDSQGRVERLLLDAMQHVSRQGLAAFPDDASREAAYRLDHVYGRKASKVADPHAGGTTGDSDGTPKA